MNTLRSPLRAAMAVVAFAALSRAAAWHANYFPNVPLTDQFGKTVRFYDDLLKGKRVVINFIYTRCGDSCPLETARLAQVAKILGDQMGRDVFFYSISVDPERDTPAELKAYADRYHAGPGWFFLTGKSADIDLIRRKLGQAARPNENSITDHSTSFTIGDEATGQWTHDSSLDDPQFVAALIRDWFSYRNGRSSPSYAAAPPLSAAASDKGAYLFQNRCAPCHSIGGGDGVGPDLRGVTATRDRAWLVRFIATPDRLLDGGDPVATALFRRYSNVRMPNLRLGEQDVNAIVRYLDRNRP